MYCNNCGTLVPDGTSFCGNCGANVAGGAPTQIQQFQNQKNAIRQSEMAELENAIGYFGQKRDLFKEYDLVSDLVVEFAGGAKKSLIVWGAIIFVVGMIALCGGGGGGSLFFVLPGAAMIAGGILMQVNNKKKYQQYLDEYVRISGELMDYYNAYPNCPVGAEYSNPDILESILGVLKSGRADTIKESINLLISDAERAEMQATMQAIESYTASASASASTAAFFAAANFFKD
ncbi:MAG: zinc ribbon domain-containing protein [Acutalibacteraceae bacterium]|nr:zinc ribbon domain-containing protein [Acutalibacteraceae bacterium]